MWLTPIFLFNSSSVWLFIRRLRTIHGLVILSRTSFLISCYLAIVSVYSQSFANENRLERERKREGRETERFLWNWIWLKLLKQNNLANQQHMVDSLFSLSFDLNCQYICRLLICPFVERPPTSHGWFSLSVLSWYYLQSIDLSICWDQLFHHQDDFFNNRSRRNRWLKALQNWNPLFVGLWKGKAVQRIMKFLL